MDTTLSNLLFAVLAVLCLIGWILVVRLRRKSEFEDALKASEARYRSLIEDQTEFIVRWQPDGTRTFVNQSYAEYFGDTPENLIGTNFFPLVLEEYRDALLIKIHNFSVESPSGLTVHEVYRPDGSTGWQEWTDRAIFDEHGQLVEIHSVGRDVTARMQAELALRESQEQLELALQGADLGLWDWHIRTGTVFFNARWAEMLGYQIDEIAPEISGWRSRLHPEDVPRAMEHTADHLAGRSEVFDIEFRMRCKDNSWRWILSRGRIVERDSEGRPLRMVGTHLDIDERKKTEVELKRSKELLEIRVEERTAELKEANERLKELDRLKSEFLATMSHELRTPLNSIIGFAGILLMELPGKLNFEQKKQLGMVNNSAKLLLTLINDVLDLSRIEAGRMELHPQWFSLQELLDEVCSSLEPQIDGKGLQLIRDWPTQELRLYSDRKRINQVLLNLVNNAMKFTERGSITVSLIPKETSVEVSVKDTGIGIMPEQMEMLFEAFRQVDGSARRNYEGSGLGLYLCRRLLELLQGSIRVESEYQIGSTFSVTLPICREKSK